MTLILPSICRKIGRRFRRRCFSENDSVVFGLRLEPLFSSVKIFSTHFRNYKTWIEKQSSVFPLLEGVNVITKRGEREREYRYSSLATASAHIPSELAVGRLGCNELEKLCRVTRSSFGVKFRLTMK